MKIFLCLAAAMLMLLGAFALADAPAIPIVSLEGDCLIDYGNWNDKETYYPATLTYTTSEDSFTEEIQIKPQGTSSLTYPKKNFTVKFGEGVELAENWGSQEKYVLKADYIDPTCSGNVVSAKLAAQMNAKYGLFADAPNYGAIDGFPVFVKINGEDAGIFNMTIPKDAWLFGMDEENPNHLALVGEGWSEACSMNSAQIEYDVDWSFEIGEANDESKAAFERMVDFVANADDKTFVEDFDQYLNLDACMNYLCYIDIAYARDNLTKNMMMVTYDGKVWYPALYDLDSLWGLNSTGTGMVQSQLWGMDYTKTYLIDDERQWPDYLLSDGNRLLHRVKKLFGDQVRERYWELRESVLSKENIMASFEAYAAQIPQEYYDVNNELWYKEGVYIRSFELMSQLMDEYLPTVDKHFKEPEAIVSSAEMSYVWEKDGVQKSFEEIENLPVQVTLSYKLDGQPISAKELAGRSGKLEAVLRVERKADAAFVYGVSALVHMDEAQCTNVAVTGAACANTEQEYACMGSTLLGGTSNVYEMQLSMDVTAFDPAQYVVTVTPVVFNGGDDNSRQVLLAAAGELSAIVQNGLPLYESMVEWQKLLGNVQTGMTTVSGYAQSLMPVEGEDDALSIMESLLTEAEADADAMLTAFGCELAADMTADARVQMLTEAAADAARTEDEKAQAAKQRGLIEKYLAVVGQMKEKKQTITEINDYLTYINATFGDLVGAYASANDYLYAVLYKTSMLYQNLANYYYGSGGGTDIGALMDWYDVIIFSNHEDVVLH